jgi:hypothetical protein
MSGNSNRPAHMPLGKCFESRGDPVTEIIRLGWTQDQILSVGIGPITRACNPMSEIIRTFKDMSGLDSETVGHD